MFYTFYMHFIQNSNHSPIVVEIYRVCSNVQVKKRLLRNKGDIDFHIMIGPVIIIEPVAVYLTTGFTSRGPKVLGPT